MDETTLRIVDGLSRSLGMQLSINELTREIARLHGKAYYANVYNKLRRLSKEGTVALIKAGKSSLVSLNFGSYLTTDLLTEMELTRKHDLFKRRESLRLLLAGIEEELKDFYLVNSLCLINPESNVSLNRAELLILLQKAAEESKSDAEAIRRSLMNLQALHNMRIDLLILGKDEFLELLKAEERNPLKEMLSNKIAFHAPQSFWSVIKDGLARGSRIRFEREAINPRKMPERTLAYNLARFGYKELGTEIEREENICIELVVTSLLTGKDARRIDAIPVVLAKNQANYNLLVFLSQKYNVSGKLLGLLKALNRIKPEKQLETVIDTLEAMKVGEVKADQSSIRERLRLYNAIG